MFSRQTLAGILLLFLSACSPGCATRSIASGTATSSADDWSAVMRLANGTALKVDDPAGTVTMGRLVTVETDQFTIAVEGAQRVFLRSDIRQIASLRRATARRARRGFLIGAIIGGVSGVIAANGQAPLAAGVWGAIGAAIGAADGRGIWDETLVYFSSNATQ